MFAVSGLLYALTFGMAVAQWYPGYQPPYAWRNYNGAVQPMPPVAYYSPANPPRYPPQLPVVVPKPEPLVNPVEVQLQKPELNNDEAVVEPNTVVVDETNKDGVQNHVESGLTDNSDIMVEEPSAPSNDVEEPLESVPEASAIETGNLPSQEGIVENDAPEAQQNPIAEQVEIKEPEGGHRTDINDEQVAEADESSATLPVVINDVSVIIEPTLVPQDTYETTEAPEFDSTTSETTESVDFD
uniref:DUF4794 domain-containing protein n=1 Tax=Panagrellus redivivus TaxID=6233 RepID=A0A7E4VS94_PANRE